MISSHCTTFFRKQPIFFRLFEILLLSKSTLFFVSWFAALTLLTISSLEICQYDSRPSFLASIDERFGTRGERSGIIDGMAHKELFLNKTDEHSSRKDTISFEKAVQRELECRKKMEMRALKPALGSASLYASAKEHQKNTSSIGMKRKTTISTLPFKPYRRFCFQSQLQRSQFSQQQPKLKNAPEPSQHQLKEKTISQLWCSLCNVPCMNAFNLEQHCQGKKHKAKLDEVKSSLDSNHKNKLLWCDLCSIPCMNEFSLAQHRLGKKHAWRLLQQQQHQHLNG